jgi:hypothetical protein
MFAVCLIGGCGMSDREELATSEHASHAWNNYHWARTANPFTLKLGDNVAAAWDAYLDTSVGDWSESSVVNLSKVAGGARNKSCQATEGRVEVCAGKYGRSGWLGVASIWLRGSHITAGTVKLNDSYFTTTRYNTSAWRNLVMCQEIGHTLGLDHQDEDFENDPLGTCMDYSDDPTLNQTPNAHDYEQLELIYDHLDAFTTLASGATYADAPGDSPANWGQRVRISSDGHQAIYVRGGANDRVITFVTWAEPR